MKNREILRYKSQLDELFKKVSTFDSDIEMQSHWAKYLCVRVSGFLEISVSSIYKNYARDKAHPYVANYVDKQLSRFHNPDMEKILNITRSFNPEWAEEIRLATEGEIKDAIVSIVANRHKVAHGDNANVTYVTIKKYYENAYKLIKLLNEQCNKTEE